MEIFVSSRSNRQRLLFTHSWCWLVNDDANLYEAPQLHTKKVLYQILLWLGFQGNIKLFVSNSSTG